MGAKQLNELLLKTFPGLQKNFNKITDWQDGIETGSIIVFEDVYFKYIKRFIKNEKISKANFEFIKLLLDSNDEYAINVVTIAIIENMIATMKKEDYVKYFDDRMKVIANNLGQNNFRKWENIK